MTYNITELQSKTDIGSLITFANSSTQGVLLGFLTIGIFIILLVNLKKSSDFVESFIVSSFLTFILAAIFSFAGWINIIYPLAYLTMTAFAGLYMYSTR